MVVTQMPYVLSFSALMIVAGLSLPRTSGTVVTCCLQLLITVADVTLHDHPAYPLMYFILFWTILLILSGAYILSHGVQYVSWPRLNPPFDALFYEGPGQKTGKHGRGSSLSRLPLPVWVKRNMVVGTMRKMPVLHKLDEIEMGTTTKQRVD